MFKKVSWKFILLNLDVIIASIAMCILVGCTFVGVIMRYVVGQPFTWIEEIQAALIVWVIFGAAGAAYRTANHAAIEVFYDFFPDGVKKILDIVILVITVATVAFLGYNVLQYMKVFMQSGRTTPVLHISYILIYAVVPVSCFLQVFNYILVKFFNYSEAVTIEGITEEDMERAEREVG